MAALLEELAAQKGTPEAPRADSHGSIELRAYFRYVDRGFCGWLRGRGLACC